MFKRLKVSKVQKRAKKKKEKQPWKRVEFLSEDKDKEIMWKMEINCRLTELLNWVIEVLVIENKIVMCAF